jgi:hypothetical protein
VERGERRTEKKTSICVKKEERREQRDDLAVL